MYNPKPPNKKYVEIEKQVAMGIYKKQHAQSCCCKYCIEGKPKVIGSHKQALNPSEILMPAPPSAHGNLLGLPQRVYILGSGRNASLVFKKIPDEAFVIALNKAVLMRRCDIWMIATTGYFDTDWWKDALNQPCLKVFGEMLALHYKADFSYRYLPDFHAPPVYEFIPMIWRAATVAGCALNMCRDKGVTEVILCGIDMFGDVYWDNSHSIWDYKIDSVWKERDALQAMIDMCRKEGMSIKTLSKTALDVEYV